MKICDISQFYSPLGGGVKRYLHEKVRWVEAHPEVAHVMVRPGPEDTVTRRGRTVVYEVASPRLPASASYRMLLSKRRILRILARERPDVLEVDGPYRAAWVAVEGGRRFGVPVVGFYHSDFPRSLGRTLERFLGRFAHACDPWTTRYVVGLYNRMQVTVAPSPAVARALDGCGVQRLRTVPLGVDVERFRPRPAAAARLREELGLAAGDALLLYVGRLAREKNVAVLLATAERLRARPDGSRYHLLLIGDGELRAKVERAAERRPEVHWRPYSQSAGELAACYSAADLLLHAGVYETFGLVSIEAQACGTRVVAVAGGGLDSTVDGETPPVLAREANGEAMAEAVVAALAAEGRDGERLESRERRRRRIVERFDVAVTFARLAGLYEQVIACARAGRELPNHVEADLQSAPGALLP